MKTPPPRWSWLLLSGFVLALDLWSKWWVEATIPHFGRREIIPGFLNFTHVRNPGVAFGFLADTASSTGPWLVGLLGLVALGFVAHLFVRTDLNDRWMLAALAMIAGGAVGNLIDRARAGAVTDFIDAYVGSYHWHTFNVADSAISVGLVILLIDGFSHRHRHAAPERSAPEGPAPTAP
jgi:signal peptidase II